MLLRECRSDGLARRQGVQGGICARRSAWLWSCHDSRALQVVLAFSHVDSRARLLRFGVLRVHVCSFHPAINRSE